MKRSIWLVFLAVLLVACSTGETEIAGEEAVDPNTVAGQPGQQEPGEVEGITPVPSEPIAQAPTSESIAPSPTAPLPTVAATVEVQDQSALDATDPDEPAESLEPSTAITVSETITAVTPVFNGPVDNTYFRGAENAPITMIDYSDFL